MPLYGFHLDVAAPPDVVAERIRTIVGRVPTFWESLTSALRGLKEPGIPFQGVVDGRTFRMRRSIRYRNSFLPLIRGRIVPTQSGSRVNVLMFMHPFSSVFMLIWLSFVGVFAWNMLNSDAAVFAGVPLVMFCFGLALSTGGFFFEAVKVMPLLSEALFRPGAVTAVRPAGASSTSGPFIERERSAAWAVPLIAIVVLLLPIVLVVNMYDRHLRSSQPFQTAFALASQSPAVKALLGEPVQAGYVLRGMVHETMAAGDAALAIPVEGPAGNGTLYAVANRVRGGWEVQRAALHVDGKSGASRIDVSPTTKPELIDYPAPGRVYLLPLDAAAAADLEALPAFYKARMDLEVTLLPPQALGADAVDPKTKQVIAEKALESIQRANPAIVDDLDSVILGVTSQDLNIPSAGWTFATNYRHGRFGVFSTARLRAVPWYAGANPEIYAVRVRKMATKNLVLLHYPVELSPDESSALASSTFTAADVDRMGPSVRGENGQARAIGSTPCVTIVQGPGRQQSWRLDCLEDPPADNRFEMFEIYPTVPLLVQSRADFSIGGQAQFSFIRKYKTDSDVLGPFGISGAHSFEILPVGDAQTFSTMELVLADGRRIHYDRTSKGTGYDDAQLRARSYMGSPFSLSTMSWNGGGWNLVTRDGWTYQFPSSWPGRTWQQSALIGIRSPSGAGWGIRRGKEGDLQELRALDGTTIAFTEDATRRIVSAKGSQGQSVDYDYDAAGMLARVHHPQNGDRYYEYDQHKRMTAVLDADRRPLLVNKYDASGQIVSQTLADGRQLRYEVGYDEGRQVSYLTITLPNGYSIAWERTRDGLTRYWPRPPGAAVTPHP